MTTPSPTPETTQENIRGLTLCRAFWEEQGLPAFSRECPDLLERAAVGLCGEGSDCFGFDDAVSRDHDWGPGFCLWLDEADLTRWGDEAGRVYASLPREFMSFRRLRVSGETAHRMGVQSMDDFFARYTGAARPPETLREWRMLPEGGLATVTNGAVFHDGAGEFTRRREGFLAYYPEELRKKKLAAACALAGQAGQYNYYRCLRRRETVAAAQALGEFVFQSQRIAFLLNRRYAPYYKWTHRALCALPLLGGELGPHFEALAEDLSGRGEHIEAIAELLIREMRRQGLSHSGSDFLLHHGEYIQASIAEPELARLPLMAE